MLDVIGSSLFSLLWKIFGHSPEKLEPLKIISWQDTAIFTLPATESDPMVQEIVQDYLQILTQQGLIRDRQGLWVQSDWTELASYQGKTPLSAASLTKIATTLTSLGKLGADYRFITKFVYTGTITEGILDGDLIVEGNGDPFFVWEEAIAVANALNKLGISKIQGDLMVNSQFYMNYESDSGSAGKLLQQAMDSNLWLSEVEKQFKTLPPNTPRPKLTVTGQVKSINEAPPNAQLLLTHQSLTLAEILKQMNIYSNNKIAQMLADEIGGAKIVAQYSAQTAGVAPSEIHLVNGSGLGVENRISPRAVSQMLMAIDNLLQPYKMNVMDLFPVSGRDAVGTMENRTIPLGTSIKTGTLAEVSALAGVIPLEGDRKIWFTIINSGWQIEYLRKQQDIVLQRLAQHWKLDFQSINSEKNSNVYLGDPGRNLPSQES